MKNGIWAAKATDGIKSETNFAFHTADENTGLDYFGLGRLNDFSSNPDYTFDENKFVIWYTHKTTIADGETSLAVNLSEKAATARFVALLQMSKSISGNKTLRIGEIEMFGEEMHVQDYIGCYLNFDGKTTYVVSSIHDCFTLCQSRNTNLFALKSGFECECGNLEDKQVASDQCQIKCANYVTYCGGRGAYSVYRGTALKQKIVIDMMVVSDLGCFIDSDLKNPLKYFERNLTACVDYCNLIYIAVQSTDKCSCLSNLDQLKPSFKCKDNKEAIHVYQKNVSVKLPASVAARYCAKSNHVDQSGNCLSGSCEKGWKAPGCFEKDITKPLWHSMSCEDVDLLAAVVSVCNFKAAYIGCYKDAFIESLHFKFVNSVKECSVYCKTSVYHKIALQAGRLCHCISLLTSALPSSDCHMKCANGEACGSLDACSVYSIKPQEYHEVVFFYDHRLAAIQTTLEIKVPYTLQMCGEFCSEINGNFFSNIKSGLCECFLHLEVKTFKVSNNIKNEKCEYDPGQVCQRNLIGDANSSAVFLVSQLYEFQRGVSSYSHCSNNANNKKLELVYSCKSGCSRSWKGESCRERNCADNNGDCGSEMKCVESVVNGGKYVECVCPRGKVINRNKQCEVHRQNIAVFKRRHFSADFQLPNAASLNLALSQNNVKLSWLAVDLENFYYVGYVVAYSQVVKNIELLHILDYFDVKLSETFNIIGNYDFRDHVKVCGSWMHQARLWVLPMKVICRDFTFATRESCDTNNGNCGEKRCIEYSHRATIAIKCIKQKPDLIITHGNRPPSIYGCFQKLKAEYEHDRYGLSYEDCQTECKSRSFKFSALKEHVKCLCGNQLLANEQMPINDCIINSYGTYLVYDVDALVNLDYAANVYRFCKNDRNKSQETTCHEGQCLLGWAGQFCNIYYVGCYQHVETTKSKEVASISDCLSTCKNDINSFIAIKGGNECHCVDRLDSAVPSSYCNISCHSKDSCGGQNYYSVYKNWHRKMHDAVFYNADLTKASHELQFSGHFTDEMCAHFCLEMDLSFFNIMLKKCGCFQTVKLLTPYRSNLVVCDQDCQKNSNEECRCYFQGRESQPTVFGTRFQYDFQRGVSSYSHCSLDKYELLEQCPEKCLAGWKGMSCRERDCSVVNGDCGSETKCIESSVNAFVYAECVCPNGTVRNKFHKCEVFRNNLALHKSPYSSSQAKDARKGLKMVAAFLTDGIYYDDTFAQIDDIISSWLAVDLGAVHCVGFVVVYNRIAETNEIRARADNFVVRLNKTFDTSANYDIRKRVNFCGAWPSEAIQGVNPMKVVCEDFNLLSRFVIVQQSEGRFSDGKLAIVELEVYDVGCDLNNGNCGKLHCSEHVHLETKFVKCDALGKDIFIFPIAPGGKSIYGCFKRIDYSYEHNEYALTSRQCGRVCKSKFYKVAAMKAGIKCFCGNKLIVNDQVSIKSCVWQKFDSYLVYDVESSVKFDEATKWNHFCKNVLEGSSEAPCKSGDCLFGWTGNLCNIGCSEGLSTSEYIPSVEKFRRPSAYPLQSHVVRTFKEADSTKKIAFVRHGEDLSLTCFTNEYSKKYRRRWYYSDGDTVQSIFVDNGAIILMKNWTVLKFVNSSFKMSNVYYCTDSEFISANRLQYHVKVYSIAQMAFNMTFSFLVSKCSSNKLQEIKRMIKDHVCKPFEGSVSKFYCPYQFSIECDDWKPNTFYSVKNIQRLVVAKVVVLKFVQDFSDKTCDVKCSLHQMHSNLANDICPVDDLREDLENQYQKVSEGRYLPEEDKLTNLKTYFICMPGFILFYQMFCVPCDPGYYSNVHGLVEHCLPCPKNTFQPEFGATSCHKCPKKYMTANEASTHAADCFNEIMNYKRQMLENSVEVNVDRHITYTGHFFVLSTSLILIFIAAFGVLYVIFICDLSFCYCEPLLHFPCL
ncbi:hypothetical protein HELRODRAFT_180449 [Helobdella robusta]|uniref:Uncharacterized protein n=1 Tax=Helobdella robusta TaxID=6412 RepID=T1FFX7_HELRO|nr:hypothetical protein HELRODRAFT_180449 [Helobdella robusta]ESN94022.1 hypothetical protein HELRODRAFT_180449 [Helobdella robusta]